MKTILLAALLMSPAVVLAQASLPVPKLLPYQGRLLKSDKTPQTGNVTLTFTIYDGATPGASVLWTEDQPVALTDQGFYAVFLGSIQQLTDLVAANIFDGHERWLGVKVSTDTTELSPRHRIDSVAYAITSTNAFNSTNATNAASAVNATNAENAVHADTATHATTADSATTANSTAAAANGVPPGAIIPFGGATPPTGFLLCDGSPVSRTTYSALFSSISTAWGSGNGSTTFNLPDLRGRFLRGTDHGVGRDPDRAGRAASASGGNAGDAVGSVEDQQLASHGHAVNDPGHSHTVTYPVGGTGGSTTNIPQGTPVTNDIRSTSGSTTGISIGSTGGNETRPVNAGVNWIIKT
jgi:microcystin-dependent protein